MSNKRDPDKERQDADLAKLYGSDRIRIHNPAERRETGRFLRFSL